MRKSKLETDKEFGVLKGREIAAYQRLGPSLGLPEIWRMEWEGSRRKSGPPRSAGPTEESRSFTRERRWFGMTEIGTRAYRKGGEIQEGGVNPAPYKGGC
jgi:hypothetical protein